MLRVVDHAATMNARLDPANLAPEDRAEAISLMDELEGRQARSNFLSFAPLALEIRTKAGEIVPLRMNAAQRHIHKAIEQQKLATGKVRAIVLKGRQQGASTYIGGRFYWLTTSAAGKQTFILTHEQAATDNLFEMTKRYHNNCRPAWRPETAADNAKELWFPRLDSRYQVATAGTKGTGRSATAQFFHGCLAAGTPVVDGITGRLRPIEDFQPGDMVRTHTGLLAPIRFRSTQTKDCIEVVMRGLRDFPLVCTREHKFLTQRGWIEGGALQVGDRIGYPVAEIGAGRMALPFAIPLAQRAQGGGAEHRVPESVAADEALGLLVGLYLAEGCVSRQWMTGIPTRVVFAMHEAEVERNAAWLAAHEPLFASMKVRPREGSKTVTIEAFGKALATRILEWCGELNDKHLPTWWRQAPREFVQGMVRGYLCGDGHFSATRDRRISATSIRSALTIGMREAIAALGFGWAGVEYKSAGVRQGRDEREAWTLRLCGAGVEGLSVLCGKPFVPRQRSSDAYGGAVVREGYAWVPIADISDDEARPVYEFEIDHADHSYCILHGATHNSEVAFWPSAADHMAGIGQTVPNEAGTEIILESTGNGLGNLFHQMWVRAQRGDSEYVAIFVPWFWEVGYATAPPAGFMLDPDELVYQEAHGLSMEQMCWRRNKLRDDFGGDVSLFNQEYPATPEMAFMRSSTNSLITVEEVALSRQRKQIEASGPRILGVDPAEYGDDDSGLVERIGRVAQWVKRYSRYGTMEMAGIVSKMALDALSAGRPYDAINVDVTGVGTGVADRLIEMGVPNVHRIHFGGKAYQADKYVNRRAECWGRMHDWIKNLPNQIADDDVLQTELTSVSYSYDSSRRLLMESKEHMKKRGVLSPDSADALALTFAESIVSSNEYRESPPADWRT